MRGKGIVRCALVLSTVFILTGCGEKFPDLTDDQYNQIVEYSVGLLMKYSNNGQEKLTYVDASEEQKAREKEARKKAKEEKDKAEKEAASTPTPEPVTPVEEASNTLDSSEDADTASSLDSVDTENGDNSSAVGSSEAKDSSNTESTTVKDTSDPSAITLSSEDSQEVMPDIFLSYQGYSISSTYPESSKSYVVNADKGKKLLVLRFDLYNASGSTKEVNMINLKLLFQILLNGKNLGYSSVTFLPNDLSSYIGSIESKAHESLVILTQIDEKDTSSIQSLGLIVTENGKEQKINLK